MQAKYMIPALVIQNIVNEMTDCWDISHMHVCDRLLSKLRDLEIENDKITSIMSEIVQTNLFSHATSGDSGPLRSFCTRQTYYTNHLFYIAPVEIDLGLDENLRKMSAQYVPILESSSRLYEKYPDKFTFPTNADSGKSKSDILSDFRDGEIFKTNSVYIEEAFQIILYQDSFEVVNPSAWVSKEKTTKFLACIILWETLRHITGQT